MKFLAVILALLPVFAMIVGSLGSKFRLETENAIPRGDLKSDLGFFAKFVDLNKDANIVISPSAMLVALMLLTKELDSPQLRSALRLNSTEAATRAAFKIENALLDINSSAVTLYTGSKVFENNNLHINESSQTTLKSHNGSGVRRLNFRDIFYKQIIEAFRSLRNEPIVKDNYTKNGQLLITSWMYFTGELEAPFESSYTDLKPFHDMNGNHIGEVEMMKAYHPFRRKYIYYLKASVLELPYKGEKNLSMFALLPDLGVSLNEVLRNIETMGKQSSIFDEIMSSESTVFLPRFRTKTVFSLKNLTKQFGFMDDFLKASANFSEADIVHTSEITVSESVYGLTLYPLERSVLSFDRPFLYFVVEKVSKLLILAGKFGLKSSSILSP